MRASVDPARTPDILSSLSVVDVNDAAAAAPGAVSTDGTTGCSSASADGETGCSSGFCRRGLGASRFTGGEPLPPSGTGLSAVEELFVFLDLDGEEGTIVGMDRMLIAAYFVGTTIDGPGC